MREKKHSRSRCAKLCRGVPVNAATPPLRHAFSLSARANACHGAAPKLPPSCYLVPSRASLCRHSANEPRMARPTCQSKETPFGTWLLFHFVVRLRRCFLGIRFRFWLDHIVFPGRRSNPSFFPGVEGERHLPSFPNSVWERRPRNSVSRLSRGRRMLQAKLDSPIC